jgi:hypothetical protein
MVENINHEQEIQFIDQTVPRHGSKYWDDIGIRCRWELHALPEYVDNDQKLSMGVVNKMVDILVRKKMKDATITLIEGYREEEKGKEHYRLSMTFGVGSENKKFVYSNGYTTEGDHGEVRGEVVSIVGLPTDSDEDHFEVSEEAASVYIGEMESTYTDWENEWSGGGFINFYN